MTRRVRCSRCGWLLKPEYLADGLCECCVNQVPLFDLGDGHDGDRARDDG
ncbi:MAG TPA: hypothetical protein VF223_18575 [Trebonia sp.]